MFASRTRVRLAAGGLLLTSVTAACGLKPEAVDSLKTPTGGTVAPGTVAGGTTGTTTAGGGATTGTVSGGGGTVSGGGGTVVAGGGTTSTGTSTTSTGTTTTRSGGKKTTTTGTSGPVSCGTPSGGDTTGVTASTINIGLHAPLTGTGTPFPNSSFQNGADTFWKQSGHEVCGRKVTVEFKDDTYTPSGARQVCSEMAKRDFLVVGGGGTDQIQACATEPTVQRDGVPYLSAGVTDNGLSGLSNYFAVSLTYAQQGTLVLKNAQQQGIANPAPSTEDSDNVPGKKAVWAIVTADSPNFAGARNGMMAALKRAGIPYKNYTVSQQGNYQASATSFGQSLARKGYKTIFVDAAPGYFVFMTGGFYGAHLGQANWVGPGVTYTEVTVAQYICTSSKGAINGHAYFLAPAPGIDHATDDFKKAYNNSYDDIEWALWGLSETLWTLLKNASGNLTRENFLSSTSRSVVPGGVYAPVNFRDHGGHFGGTGAWVQKVNCNKTEPNQDQPGAWDTVGSHYLSLY